MAAARIDDAPDWPSLYRELVRHRLSAEVVFGVEPRERGGHERRIPCPLHGGRDANFVVNTRTLTWFCHSRCQVGGDAIEFVMKAEGLGFKEAVIELGRRVGETFDEGPSTGTRPKPPPSKPVARPVVREEPPRYPPAELVDGLWASSVRVDEDDEASAYLLGRTNDAGEPRPIDPTGVADRDLARVLPRALALPRGCAFKSRSWHETGHRIVVPLYDAQGRRRTLIARRVRETDTPKTLPLAGFEKKRLVMADGLAQQMLTAGARPAWWSPDAPFRIYACEGETDFLTGVLSLSEADEHAPAVIGIGSGAWSQELADRIPDDTKVVIASDIDAAGEAYETQIRRTLLARIVAGRIEVRKWRP